MSTPLTDSIQNLTSYINGVTGEEDTNLSDAVATLADGYGGYSDVQEVTIDNTTQTMSEGISALKDKIGENKSFFAFIDDVSFIKNHSGIIVLAVYTSSITYIFRSDSTYKYLRVFTDESTAAKILAGTTFKALAIPV